MRSLNKHSEALRKANDIYINEEEYEEGKAKEAIRVLSKSKIDPWSSKNEQIVYRVGYDRGDLLNKVFYDPHRRMRCSDKNYAVKVVGDKKEWSKIRVKIIYTGQLNREGKYEAYDIIPEEDYPTRNIRRSSSIYSDIFGWRGNERPQ